MIIRDITNYLQGKLSEEEAIKLWIRLAADDKAYNIFEFCYLIRRLFAKRGRV